jgi:hypothetical protein
MENKELSYELDIALNRVDLFLQIHRKEARRLHRTERYSDRLDSAESGLSNLFELDFWAYNDEDRMKISRVVRTVARATKQARHAQIGMYHGLNEQMLEFCEENLIDLGPHV